MTAKRNILVFMGTRPEAVKLAPVVTALRAAGDFHCTVVATGQHKEMFRQVADTFGIAVDADLEAVTALQAQALAGHATQAQALHGDGFIQQLHARPCA